MGTAKVVGIGAGIVVAMISLMGSNADQLETKFNSDAELASVDPVRSSSNTKDLAAERPAATASKAEPVKPGDLDDAEKAIGLAINLAGYLCAKPTEVVEAGPQLYGVHCITNRDGTGRSNYLVNSRTHEVTPI